MTTNFKEGISLILGKNEKMPLHQIDSKYITGFKEVL